MRAGLILFGWALLGLTFFSLLGEMAARGHFETRSFYHSAEELWAALAPDSFAEFRSWFRSAARPFWTYGFAPILKFPAWILFGLPGLLAIVYAHRLDRTPPEFNIEGAFLYDELVARAKEEGYLDAETRSPEDAYGAMAASAREAEADLIREPIVVPSRGNEEAKAAPVPDAASETARQTFVNSGGDSPAASEKTPPPLNRLPS